MFDRHWNKIVSSYIQNKEKIDIYFKYNYVHLNFKYLLVSLCRVSFFISRHWNISRNTHHKEKTEGIFIFLKQLLWLNQSYILLNETN